MLIDTTKVDLAAVITDQRRYYAVVVPVEVSEDIVQLILARPIERPVKPSAPPRAALVSDVAARALIAAEDRCY